LSDAQVADRLARAVNIWGSMAKYPCNTVLHLEETGIRDACLWRMQGAMAERLAALPVPAWGHCLRGT